MSSTWFVRDDACVVINAAREITFRGTLASALPGIASTPVANALAAALQTRDGFAYLFSGAAYFRYDLARRQLVEGPLDTAAHWPGTARPEQSLELSAVCLLDKLTAAFFSGSIVTLYDLVYDRVIATADVGQTFEGVPAGTQVTAALLENGNLFLLAGEVYFEVDPVTRHARTNAARRVDSRWDLQGFSYSAAFTLANQVDAHGLVASAAPPADEGPHGSVPARALSLPQARQVLDLLHQQQVLRLAPIVRGNLVGLTDASIYGVTLQRSTGSRTEASIPRAVDARNLVAVARLARWLVTEHAVDGLVHLGIDADERGSRTDAQGQGRAIALTRLLGAHDGARFEVDVGRDWGAKSVPNEHLPLGARLSQWPPGTRPLSFRLNDSPDADLRVAELFKGLYAFAASQWQDRDDRPLGLTVPTTIGERSLIVTPDHPLSDPAGRLGREAHQDRIHVQIGPTAREFF